MTSDVQWQLTDSERDWLAIRDYLRSHRSELDVRAAAEYPDAVKVGGTPLLATPGWIPDTPLPLDAVDLELVVNAPRSGVTGADAQPGLPRRASGEPYESYSQAVGELAAPTVFENRPTYRLLEADLTTGHGRGRLVFGRGAYFDGLDTGEAAGHEAALAHLGRVVPGGIRERIGDPCDLRRRPVNLAITTLTIRRAADGDTFLLHWRDPGKVGHAGGLHQVVPVGIFQPSGAAAWNLHNDFSLWRNMIREFSEELLGQSEDYHSEQAPIDYHAWPFAARLEQARADGQLRVYCLGLGVDPLTFAADLLTAVVIDAPVFDDLFTTVVADNAEGRVTTQPFNPNVVDRILNERPMQAAGAALLRLATTHDLA